MAVGPVAVKPESNSDSEMVEKSEMVEVVTDQN